MSGVTELPECEHRETTDQPQIYFCQQSRMRVQHGLVTPGICRICSVRELPCDSPRLRGAALEAVVSGPGSASTPRPPSLWQQGWNVTAALAAFTADGFRTTSKEEYERRLQICESCDKRVDNRCMECGCGLVLKASGNAFQCPLGKW